jgi:hypothetical protein
MLDEDDLQKLIDDDDAEFEFRCKRCGSTDVKLEDDRRNFDSCGMGSLDLVCKNCKARKTLVDNNY